MPPLGRALLERAKLVHAAQGGLVVSGGELRADAPDGDRGALLLEARVGVVVAIIAAFGSIISEVGAAMLVGGNIEGRTRVLTTAIVLETRKGNFELAVALGLVLIGLTFVANLGIHLLQGRPFTR